jgi:hypothetical protein
MPKQFSSQSTTYSSVNTPSKGATDTSALNCVGFVIISFPILLFMGITAYKKYRTLIFRRRIALLEKLWLIDVKNNTYRQD